DQRGRNHVRAVLALEAHANPGHPNRAAIRVRSGEGEVEREDPSLPATHRLRHGIERAKRQAVGASEYPELARLGIERHQVLAARVAGPAGVRAGAPRPGPVGTERPLEAARL